MDQGKGTFGKLVITWNSLYNNLAMMSKRTRGIITRNEVNF
jgi:hypothetical protein